MGKCADPVLCYTLDSGNRIIRNFSFVKSSLLLPYFKPLSNCGKCIHCRRKQSYELACRCVLHSSLYKQNCFVTLTYDEKNPQYHNTFHYPDIQLFKKRLQSYVRYHFKKSIKIFNVHEYGKNGKKHWHLVVFDYDFEDKTLFTVKNGNSIFTSEKLEALWPHGFNTIGEVTEASAMYQAQYMEKDFKNGHAGTFRKSHSKHSGIGRPYFYAHYSQLLRLGYVPINGRRLPLPRYFQRLAHRHYCYFYEPTAFLDYRQRKAIHRPFKKEEPIKAIADLWPIYKSLKEPYLKELEDQWDEVISQYLQTKEDPDFIKSHSNTIYDLRNKLSKDNF